LTRTATGEFAVTYREFRQAPTAAILEAKARQSSKIREFGTALRRAGLIRLDEQARALGLSRSTTWRILKGDRRASGLSATVISRMLSAPSLPPVVRAKILEYVQEKTGGSYGHGKRQLLEFSAQIRYAKSARDIRGSRSSS
jgi:predicted DNA-binding transcriptional regulator AlpA